MTRRKRNFTLIELLVVITIIAILAAMLLPALSQSKEKAKRAVCSGYLKQVGQLLVSHGADHDRKLPYSNPKLSPGHGIDSTYSVGNSKPYGLAILVTEGYLSDDGARIFYCPSWDHPWNQYNQVDEAGDDPWFGANRMGGWPAPGKTGPTAHRGISYMYRATFGASTNEAAKLTDPNPSGTAITADHWVFREVRYGIEYGHGDGYVTQYLDGHVSWTPDRYYYMIGAQPSRNNGSWAQHEFIWQDFFDK